jgi:hypothetical protein
MYWMKTYLSSWWMPFAVYAGAVGLLVAIVATGLFALSAFMAAVTWVASGCLALTGFGMLLASCVNYGKGRKLEGVVNLLFFTCAFALPAILYYSIGRLMA